MKTFMNAVVDSSPTVVLQIAEAIENAPHKAVSLNGDGKAELSTSGVMGFGVILGNTLPELPEGAEVSVLIKDIGLIVAGEDIAAGDPVAAGDYGVAVTAGSGMFILGFALDSAAEGDHFRIQITKSGYMP
ncbi:MAG: DUF2190 family protein [Oscillospiraceae bacterium]|nr:DUF2190 family protein [Oscillospiraceae bacterium]